MLADTQCRNAKAKGKPYKLVDEKGLYLEVKPNGSKVWRYRFELVREGARKESIFTIGEYCKAPQVETVEEAQVRRNGGHLTLGEARIERGRLRGLVKQGINPVQNRRLDQIKREQESATTFEAVAKEWLALKDWEEVTKTRRLGLLERVVFPSIGALPVKQVTPAHILEILKRATKENGPTVAAEAKRTMSGVFDLAVSTIRADFDPVYPVRKSVPANKTQHKRPLSPDEVGQLLRDIAGYDRNFQTVAAFRLMWLTLCRPNEVMGARWEELDLEARVWRIPASRMKKRKEHAVPLSSQAIELLKKMKGITGHRDHVFPNRDDRDRPMANATLRQALKNLGWSGKFSPHATRTTGSTWLNEMGFSFDWIERQLAHAETNTVRATYNHATYLTDRAQMMQKWADMLDLWQSGAKVLPLMAVVS